MSMAMNSILELVKMLDDAEWIVSALSAMYLYEPGRSDGCCPTKDEVREEAIKWLNEYDRVTGSAANEDVSQNCPGCGRNELHKMCPAYGTEHYMSGHLFTLEMEKDKESIVKGVLYEKGDE